MVRTVVIPLCLALLFVILPGLTSSVKARTLRVGVIAPAGSKRASKSVLAAVVRDLRSQQSLQVVAKRGRKAARLRRCLRSSGCIRSVGERMGLDLLLAGKVRKRGRRVVVDLLLISAKEGTTLASETLKAKGHDLRRKAAMLASRMVLNQASRSANRDSGPASGSEPQVAQADDPEDPT